MVRNSTMLLIDSVPKAMPLGLVNREERRTACQNLMVIKLDLDASASAKPCDGKRVENYGSDLA
jgi:hypothetical protein